MLSFPNHYKKLEELIWSYNQDFPIPDGISHTRIPLSDGLSYVMTFMKIFMVLILLLHLVINILVQQIYLYYLDRNHIKVGPMD